MIFKFLDYNIDRKNRLLSALVEIRSPFMKNTMIPLAVSFPLEDYLDYVSSTYEDDKINDGKKIKHFVRSCLENALTYDVEPSFSEN